MHSDNKYRLKPSLAEKFNGIIWKIEIDDVLPLIALECRDLENRTASFSLFDFVSGKQLFKDATVEDGWNWGLDRVFKGYVFLHGQVSEQSPEHKGIIALNQNGKIEWQQFNKTLDDISAEGLVVYDPNLQPRIKELEDPHTGNIIKRGIKEIESIPRDISLPQLSPPEAELKNVISEEVVGLLSFLFTENKKIYSYHTKSLKGFNQQLLIIKDDKVVLKEYLATDIQKLNPEAFFVAQRHLFCIRNEKREIVSYLV